MRLFLPLVALLFLSGCAENYYACRSNGGARDYCDLTTQPPPAGGGAEGGVRSASIQMTPVQSASNEAAHTAAGGT
jgi:hypothetical protein